MPKLKEELTDSGKKYQEHHQNICKRFQVNSRGMHN